MSPLSPYYYPPCELPTPVRQHLYLWQFHQFFLNTFRIHLHQQEGCVEKTITNPADCAARGYKWLWPAMTQSDCQSRGQGCLEMTTDFAFTKNQILTYKPEAECLKAGGTPTPLVQWTSGLWLKYKAKPLQWLTRRWRPTTKLEPTFNFYQFDIFMSEAIDKKYSFQVKSDAQCRYHKVGEALVAYTCDCAVHGLKDASCFDKSHTMLAEKLNLTWVANSPERNVLNDKSVAFSTLCPEEAEEIEVRTLNRRLFFFTHLIRTQGSTHHHQNNRVLT